MRESYVSAHNAENNMINDAKVDGDNGLRRTVDVSRFWQKNYVVTYGEIDDKLKHNNMDPWNKAKARYTVFNSTSQRW